MHSSGSIFQRPEPLKPEPKPGHSSLARPATSLTTGAGEQKLSSDEKSGEEESGEEESGEESGEEELDEESSDDEDEDTGEDEDPRDPR